MKGNPSYGYWIEDTTNDRCILKCSGGYEPSGCHVIRYKHWVEKWNHDIPICQEGKAMEKLFTPHPDYPTPITKFKTIEANKNNPRKESILKTGKIVAIAALDVESA